MEYASNGTLFNLVASKNGLSEKDAHKYFLQILYVLEMMHKNNIVHRDIKLENILVNSKDELQLCDFANAVYINSNTDCKFIPSAGTAGCRAPEIIK